LTQLGDIRHLVIDMDGVLYRGNDPLPGLAEFFELLHEQGIGFRLATNNSGSTPRQYAAKMKRMGIAVTPAEIITSGTATARWLAQRHALGARVHVFGEDSLRNAVTEVGFELADEEVVAVVTSIDWGVTYEKIKRACLLIRAGAQFVATNLDPTRPTEEGLVPGTGALIAAIATGAERQPICIGKPEPIMFEQAMAEMRARPETTATLGDRIDTDMVGGARAGLKTILVLSGSTGRAEGEAYGPDLLFEDIADLTQAWRAEVAASADRRPASRAPYAVRPAEV
jgi:4-nitrophenyl phosphatase